MPVAANTTAGAWARRCIGLALLFGALLVFAPGAHAQAPGVRELRETRSTLALLRSARPAERARRWDARGSVDGLVGLELARVERSLGRPVACRGHTIATPCEYGGVYEEFVQPCTSDDQHFYVGFVAGGEVHGLLLAVTDGVVVSAAWTVWPGSV